MLLTARNSAKSLPCISSATKTFVGMLAYLDCFRKLNTSILDQRGMRRYNQKLHEEAKIPISVYECDRANRWRKHKTQKKQDARRNPKCNISRAVTQPQATVKDDGLGTMS